MGILAFCATTADERKSATALRSGMVCNMLSRVERRLQNVGGSQIKSLTRHTYL